MSKLLAICGKYKLLKIVCSQYLQSIKYRRIPIYGITDQKREPKIIVSLTSYPKRIKEVHLTITSLLYQSLKPDEIILWLSEEEFKNKEQDLPKSLLKLTKYGLTIKFCEGNIKSYKKLIPAIKEYPNDIIVLADDDVYYKKDWLVLLYKSYLKDKQAIHCHRAHRVLFDENNDILPYCNWDKTVTKQAKNEVYLATGVGGILINPDNPFYKDLTNETLFMQLAPNADDLWFWAMMILNNTRLKIAENNIIDLLYVNPIRDYGISSEETLYKSNGQGGNDKQLKQIMQFYPQIKEKLKEIRGKNVEN